MSDHPSGNHPTRLAPGAEAWSDGTERRLASMNVGVTERRRALVVEDNPDARALVRTYLRKMDFEVVEAAEGRSAIRALASSRPDLVCLDLMLPELSGFEVCEYMRSRPELRDVPILVMSARAKPMDRAFAEEVGATAYLIKPFKLSELSRAVAACIARASPPKGDVT